MLATDVSDVACEIQASGQVFSADIVHEQLRTQTIPLQLTGLATPPPVRNPLSRSHLKLMATPGHRKIGTAGLGIPTHRAACLVGETRAGPRPPTTDHHSTASWTCHRDEGRLQEPSQKARPTAMTLTSWTRRHRPSVLSAAKRPQLRRRTNRRGPFTTSHQSMDFTSSLKCPSISYSRCATPFSSFAALLTVA